MTKEYFSEPIMPYDEREALKQKGDELISQCKSAKEKAILLINYRVKAHYWRAVEQLYNSTGIKSKLKKIYGEDYAPGIELGIDRYSRHWVYCNADSFDKEVCKELKNIVEPLETKYIKKGNTIYNFSKIYDN
jgi:hypothetical protein